MCTPGSCPARCWAPRCVLCSQTLLGRQGALSAHSNALQPQDKGQRCSGLQCWGCDLRGPGVLSYRRSRNQAHAHPLPRVALRSCLQSFLRFHPSRFSLPFLCICPLPSFLCVSVSFTPSVLHLSSLPLDLSVSYYVSCLVCVSDSNRGGPVSLCPRDLRWYPLCVSGGLLFRRGGSEISLVRVEVGGGDARAQHGPPSPTVCHRHLLETVSEPPCLPADWAS